MTDDLAAGRGFAFLDAHGTSAERIADCIPIDHLDDVIYFDPTALRCPLFNPLDTDDPDLTAESPPFTTSSRRAGGRTWNTSSTKTFAWSWRIPALRSSI
jgi:hypothetical protein